MGRCGLVVGIGCCGHNHIITLAVHSIFTGSIFGFHMTEGGREKPRDSYTFDTKTKLAGNHTKTKKKHPTSNFSLCRSCLVVWIRCWGSSHSIFTCTTLG